MIENDNQLMALTELDRMLAETTRIDELIDLSAKIKAVEIYKKATGESIKACNEFTYARVKAHCKIGKVLSETIFDEGTKSQLQGPGVIGGSNIKPPINKAKLSDFGISKTNSHRWQTIQKYLTPDERDTLAASMITSEFNHVLSENLFFKAASKIKQEHDRGARLESAQNIPPGIYNVIYADPPWEYDNSGLMGSAESHYPTMKTKNICELLGEQEVETADNAVLFLWVTNPLLEDGLQVLNSWGFNYKTSIVWRKNRATYGKLGFYVFTEHELLLIATKGSCLPVWQPTSVHEAKKGKHSAKPDEFREVIERMYPEHNYLELFARNQPERNGWVFWGDEA